MGKEFEVKIEGIKELKKVLNKVDKDIKTVMPSILRETLKPILKEVKATVPVSDKQTFQRRKAANKGGKPYKHLKNTLKISTKKDRSGKSFRAAITGGIKASLVHLLELGTKRSRKFPFLGPAWDRNKPRLKDNFKDAVDKIIIKLKRKYNL